MNSMLSKLLSRFGCVTVVALVQTAFGPGLSHHVKGNIGAFDLSFLQLVPMNYRSALVHVPEGRQYRIPSVS